MQKNEHKRVKHGQHPGDVHKRVKIAMREKDSPIEVASWHTISDNAAKSYRKHIAKKGRKVQRRRDKKEIADQEALPEN
jgi:hypothetical protein